MRSSKYLRKLMLRQWDALAGIALLTIALAAWKGFLPFGKEIYTNAREITGGMALLDKADSIAALPGLVRMKADKTDSCLAAISSVPVISEQEVPGTVYALADRAGIKASKVEISKKELDENGSKIPISFRGEGDYIACGKFIDGIENMRPSGRIIELNMKNAGNGHIGLFVDFILLAQK